MNLADRGDWGAWPVTFCTYTQHVQLFFLTPGVFLINLNVTRLRVWRGTGRITISESESGVHMSGFIMT